MSDGTYLAHTENIHGQVELVHEHLRNVADRAYEFASQFNSGEEARMSGLFHDLGKYGDLFQQRLKGLVRGIDHWSAGAWVALRCFESIAGALAIQGHHIGLQVASGDALRETDPSHSRKDASTRVSEPDVEILLKRLREDLQLSEERKFEDGHYGRFLRKDSAAAMLDVRMLFSALVDADFIETETHFEGGSIRPDPMPLEADRAFQALLDYLAELMSGSNASSHVNSMRSDVLEACLKAAERHPGLFTLTAPTGTGKTLSMLAFALKHAKAHGLRRVVFVIPYLSIIDQTVDTYMRVFARMCSKEEARRYVLEHHSLAGTRTGKRDVEDSDGRRMAAMMAENWDAPIVVTTSVQMLESLFANRPAPCRKLHRLARSVILFDEVQTIPRILAVPTLATLSRLSERYGSTVVFATATQPAFGEMDKDVRKLCVAGWSPAEIVPEDLDLAERARRVEVHWPEKSDETTPWSKISTELAEQRQVLCIVNLKRHAVSLFKTLADREAKGLFHLSTSMCPKHRETVIGEVRRRIESRVANDECRPCRLVSTQCIEAGVDIDFPVVFRAWGPLEAIVQAAGRCNRNGKDASGEVRVFIPETENGRRRSMYPDGTYQQAADVLSQMLRKYGPRKLDIHDPDMIAEYYRAVFKLMDSVESSDVVTAILNRDFVEVDRKYRLIDNDSINVLVPYDKNKWRSLKDEVMNTGLTRSWIARARPYTVSLFRPGSKDDVIRYLDPVPIRGKKKSGERSEEWFVYTEEDHYRHDIGLLPPVDDEILMV